MPFYSFEMILVGIILLSGMAAGGVKLWLTRKQDSQKQSELSSNQQNSD
jgi:type II secretory pathway pseudopilin PulG